VDHLVSKLSGICYAVKSLSHISNRDTLKLIYFAYFNFLMKYGVIFWGKYLTARRYLYCRRKFLESLWAQNLPCKYIISLLNFILNNLEDFQTNSVIHCVNTRNMPICIDQLLTWHVFRKAHMILASTSLRSLMNVEAKFKIVLKQNLNTHSFYSVDEYLMASASERCVSIT
jgi:hypothetical protein